MSSYNWREFYSENIKLAYAEAKFSMDYTYNLGLYSELNMSITPIDAKFSLALSLATCLGANVSFEYANLKEPFKYGTGKSEALRKSVKDHSISRDCDSLSVSDKTYSGFGLWHSGENLEYTTIGGMSIFATPNPSQGNAALALGVGIGAFCSTLGYVGPVWASIKNGNFAQCIPAAVSIIATAALAITTGLSMKNSKAKAENDGGSLGKNSPAVIMLSSISDFKSDDKLAIVGDTNESSKLEMEASEQITISSPETINFKLSDSTNANDGLFEISMNTSSIEIKCTNSNSSDFTSINLNDSNVVLKSKNSSITINQSGLSLKPEGKERITVANSELTLGNEQKIQNAQKTVFQP